MAKAKRTKKRASTKGSAGKNVTSLGEANVAKAISLSERVASLKLAWWLPCPKRFLLIRPKVPGDDYTELGSFGWAEDVKTKANAEGWNVTDLDANNATRAKIEDTLNNVKPHLVIHYDHGSNFTLWGQKNNAFEAGLDDSNIDLASGRLVSTVSCRSANGLGPSAITKGVVSYIGYTDLHTFWTHRAAEFGQASNAANFVLLEGGTAQEAFDAGWAAYHQLYNDLMTAGDLLAAATALHDRDCLALLGSASSVAPPRCVCPFAHPLHCKLGGPDSACRYALPLHCIVGNPDSPCDFSNPYVTCKYGNPYVLCKYGNPMILCKYGNPIQPCKQGLPMEELCVLGMPKSPPVCGAGPEGCQAGPPLVLQDIIKDFPEDIVIVDRAKIPPAMRKAFDNMISRMQREGR